MLNNYLLRSGGSLLLFLASVSAVQAASNGKSDLDSVVPAGPMDSASGAPVAWSKPINDQKLHKFVQIDRLEYGDPEGPNNYLWDAQGWVGGDFNKLWLKTEGEGPISGGSPESTEFQALYNRMISPFWGAQVGLRYDVNPNPDRGFAVIGLQGLAPYWFESDTALFVSEDGDVSFRGEFEYELLLTQRLILQPRLEINASARDTPEYGLGRGLNNTEMGVRLRYEIRREFAPYIGVRWEQKYGDTKDIARAEGESTSSTAFVVGVRAWY
ncbi:copper resistance protein B [Salinisphaera sp. T31B1]|uniref:copper resistance protein B n=1 Tax=Salinisphaera sp. T31B1 TaxID=727963 RepID=UPI00333F3932